MDADDALVAVFPDHSAAESAVVGGASAIGAAHTGIGIPNDSVLQYETAIKADSFLVMAHGTPAEMARAKTILATTQPASLDMHAGMKLADFIEPLTHVHV